MKEIPMKCENNHFCRCDNSCRKRLLTKPREKPLIFGVLTVKATLNGWKNQTRMPVTPHPQRDKIEDWQNDPKAVLAYSPYGNPGDLLWVREAWRVGKPHDHLPGSRVWPREDGRGVSVCYEAGGIMDTKGNRDDFYSMPEWAGRKRNARLMPRWASRITLKITNVRVERLQDISQEDCWKEGVEYIYPHLYDEIFKMAIRLGIPYEAPRVTFACLWESIHGEGSWDANPLVWVIEYRRVK